MSPRLALALLLCAPSAFAQATSGFDAHGFSLAPLDTNPRDTLAFARASRFEAQSWFAGALVDYAAQPLVFEPRPGERIVALDNLLTASLGAGYAPHDRLRIDLGAPIFLTGTDASGQARTGFGDMSVRAVTALVRPTGDTGGTGLALVTSFSLPTGDAQLYYGAGGVTGLLALSGTAELEGATLSAQLGTRFRPSTLPADRPAPTRHGDTFTWAVGLGHLTSPLTGIHVEVYGEAPLDPVVRAAVGVPAEALVSVRHTSRRGTQFVAGIGSGLTRGAGAAPVRLLVGGGVGKRRATASEGALTGGESTDADAIAIALADERPSLHVALTAPDGISRAGAALRLTPAATNTAEAVEADVAIVHPGLLPGTRWRVDAQAGACWRGSQELLINAGANEISVLLAADHPSTVTVRITDPTGAPLPHASGTLVAEDPRCVGAVTSPTPATLAATIGRVPVTLSIGAVGFVSQLHTFDGAAGDAQSLEIALQPTP